MKNFIYFILVLSLSLSSWAQENLVHNPSFEGSKNFHSGTRHLNKAAYIASYWYSPLDKRSPHLYKSPERSVAKANSGIAAVGLVLGGTKKEKKRTEYITGTLSSPMVKGQAYCISFNMLLHRSSKWSSSNIGVLLHHDRQLVASVSELEMLEASLYANAGDYVSNTKWVEYNGYYVASGGERFISLGAFGDSKSIEIKELGLKPYFQLDGLNSKAYYQFDDISVVAKNDSTDCGCAEPPSKNKNIKKELQPYLFALDISGSMAKDAVFDSLRSSLVGLLNYLPKGTRVTFSTFSSNSKQVFSGVLDRNTAKQVDVILSNVILRNGTNVFSGLERAAKSLSSNGQDSARIVLISDGDFTVTEKIENIVKSEFVNKGRRLTVVQIESKAKGAEKLAPYQTNFIQVAPSELRSAISQVYQPLDFSALACECLDNYTDTMNYHFVIDYSGSMKMHKNRAIRALSGLYQQAPNSAIISITAFSQEATELYVGKKSEMSLGELKVLLRAHVVNGGTDPTPGVKHGLGIAQRMSKERFSHLVIITDLKAKLLNDKQEMKSDIKKEFETTDMAVSSVTVDLNTQQDILVSGRAQFDVTTGIFRNVSKAKFEKDLFDTKRSCCDYTTQPYHYNPAKDIAKEDAKKAVKAVWKELKNSDISIGY